MSSTGANLVLFLHIKFEISNKEISKRRFHFYKRDFLHGRHRSSTS